MKKRNASKRKNLWDELDNVHRTVYYDYSFQKNIFR